MPDPIHWLELAGHRAVWKWAFPLTYAYGNDITARQRSAVEDAISRWERARLAPKVPAIRLFRPYRPGLDRVDVLIVAEKLGDLQLHEGEFTMPNPGMMGPMEMPATAHADPEHLARVVYHHQHDSRAVEAVTMQVERDEQCRRWLLPSLVHEIGHVLLLDHTEAPSDRHVMRADPRVGVPSPAELRAVRERWGRG